MNPAEVLYENPWFRVIKQDRWHWVDEPKAANGAVILPMLADGSVVLIEVERQAQGGLCLELPRGYGEPDEDAIGCAIRELREETGYCAARQDCRVLGRVQPNSALLSSSIAIILATLPKGAGQVEPGPEASRVLTVTWDEFRDAIACGKISDGFSLAAFAFMAAHQP